MNSMEVKPSEIGTNDVLFGRGGATNNHIGNKKFRTVVAQHQAEYLGARKRDKAFIARKIVGIVRERGGRFLRRDRNNGCWSEVGERKATEKTSQALREGLDVRNRRDTAGASRSDRLVKPLPLRSDGRHYEESSEKLSDAKKPNESHSLPDLADEISSISPVLFVYEPLTDSSECDQVVEV